MLKLAVSAGEFSTPRRRAVRGSLCQDCNKAAHTPKLTICYHNGGHYDFHFLLRGFAKLRHAALTAASARPEKEKPSSSLADRRKLRTFSVKELSRRVQKVKLQTLVEALPKAVVDTLRDCKVSILQRSGERT